MNIKFLFIAAAVIGVVLRFIGDEGGIDFSQPLHAETRTIKATRMLEFTPLFQRERPLSALARKDVYTVVEVYIKTCSTCREVERQLPAFLAQRDDVVVRRVHFPEHGISWRIDEAVEMEQRMNGYRICGMPHVEIYGPAGEPLAVDDCGKKHGLNFLRAWMKAETTPT